MQVPALDNELGITVYATNSEGINGVIRQAPEDFLVEEVLVDNSIADINKAESKPALHASASRQRYLLCIMVKRNWDTFIAIKNIAKQLGIDQTRISIAGIKDAKAVTAQHITIENITVEDIRKINIKDIEIHPIGYFRDTLSPFYLLGNFFTITVKELYNSKSMIRPRITNIAKEFEDAGGIPNFFGHQRFGTTRAITHIVGKAMIKGNFPEAAMIFLAKPSPYEHPESRQAREVLQTNQDFSWALQNFPKQLRFERLMLQHLAENPVDFPGAFKRLPMKLQALFVQAYQSYLFNRFLSARIRSGFSSNKARIGDYVVNVERSGLTMPKSGRIVTNHSVDEINDAVKVGKMRLALPLVGFRQRLSEGEMGELERLVLEEEHVELADFRVQALPRISGQGELRSIVSPVRNFMLEDISGCNGSLKVKLSFMLLRGSYATMVLRELMKPQDPIKAGF
jgi:tRNA pseudouridine13 synthase